MALTEYEQHQLQLLAEQLLKDDARLAAKLSSDALELAPTRHTATGGFTLLVGSMVLLTGIAAQIPPLGVLGFTITVAGAYLLSLGIRGRSIRSRPKGTVPGESGPVASP